MGYRSEGHTWLFCILIGMGLTNILNLKNFERLIKQSSKHFLAACNYSPRTFIKIGLSMSLGYSIIKLMISSSEILESSKLFSLYADSPLLKDLLG